MCLHLEECRCDIKIDKIKTLYNNKMSDSKHYRARQWKTAVRKGRRIYFQSLHGVHHSGDSYSKCCSLIFVHGSNDPWQTVICLCTISSYSMCCKYIYQSFEKKGLVLLLGKVLYISYGGMVVWNWIQRQMSSRYKCHRSDTKKAVSQTASKNKSINIYFQVTNSLGEIPTITAVTNIATEPGFKCVLIR